MGERVEEEETNCWKKKCPLLLLLLLLLHRNGYCPLLLLLVLHRNGRCPPPLLLLLVLHRNGCCPPPLFFCLFSTEMGVVHLLFFFCLFSTEMGVVHHHHFFFFFLFFCCLFSTEMGVVRIKWSSSTSYNKHSPTHPTKNQLSAEMEETKFGSCVYYIAKVDLVLLLYCKIECCIRWWWGVGKEILRWDLSKLTHILQVVEAPFGHHKQKKGVRMNERKSCALLSQEASSSSHAILAQLAMETLLLSPKLFWKRSLIFF